MREFELIIDEAFKKGLSPEVGIPSNSQFLRQALGFRCGKLGLEISPEGDNPLPPAANIHYVWPFPQFIVGERYNVLVVRDTIDVSDYIYSVSDDFLTVTLIATIDIATYGTGWLVDIADFGEYAFMTNGVAMVYWNVAGGVWATTLGTAFIPLLGTVCNFKGQMVGGNAQSAWFDCDSTFYLWSRIGSADFRKDISNEAGYRRCPYGGVVYHTRRLGDSVVGYSSKGITLLTPVNDPAPTMGFTELLNVGLCNRGAVNGSLDRHIFVGEDLIVREITKGGIKELGYYTWMEELDDDGEDIIVSYDRTGDFYIGNSTRTFLLSSYGMTDIPQHPSAVWRNDPGNVYMLPDTVDAGFKPTITSEIFDMGYKGQKTVFEVETDAFLVTNPFASVDWANNLTTWGYGNFVPINDMGIATIIASGNFFLFNLRFDTIADAFRIGYMRIRYKMTDLRGMRGIYAPPPRGQS